MEKLKLTSSARARRRAATLVGDLIKLAVMLAFVFPFYRFRPLTLAIERLRDAEVGIRWNTLMAGNCLLTLPILIVFCFASRKIIQGFAYRGMK